MATEKQGAGALIIRIVFWLVSLTFLLATAALGIGGAFDNAGPGRGPFWIMLTLSVLALALAFNPLIWKTLRRALHPVVTIGLGVVVSFALLIAAFTTPYGSFVGAYDTPSMRTAANKGSPDARLALAQRLLNDTATPPSEAIGLLRQGGAAGDADAQALLIILTMGQSFEGRKAMTRNDPQACRLMAELETAPRFVGQAVDPDWLSSIREEARHRGWRRPNEPGEPLKCERASPDPTEQVFRFVDEATVTIPDRFNDIADLQVEVGCIVQPDGTLADCAVSRETPQGRGVGDWGLSVARNDRVAATDIYGWPSAGRQIAITLSR